MLFLLLYAALGSPKAAAMLFCSCLCCPCKPKTKKWFKRQFYLLFWQFTALQ